MPPAHNLAHTQVKDWLLLPPRYTAATGAATSNWRRWASEPQAMRRLRLPAGLPLRCTQAPGDLLLLPDTWGHATLNRGFNLGVGNLYRSWLTEMFSFPRGDALSAAVAARTSGRIKQAFRALLVRELGYDFIYPPGSNGPPRNSSPDTWAVRPGLRR